MFNWISKRPATISLTIGTFDGVHRAHDSIFKYLVSCASENSSRAIVFDVSPRIYFLNQVQAQTDCLLSSIDEKLNALKKYSLDMITILSFDQKIRNYSPEDFFERFLLRFGIVKEIVVGYNFLFGKNKSGNLDVLQDLCNKNNIHLTVIPQKKTSSGVVISSNTIRQFLKKSNLDSACHLLGHNYYIHGEIKRGNGLGREIGYPTANVQTLEKKLLPRGVFLSKIFIQGRLTQYWAVCNIGCNPTVNQQCTPVCQVEAHLLNFHEDIYDQVVKLELIKKIRDEKKFFSINDLKQQIKMDIQCVFEQYPQLFPNTNACDSSSHLHLNALHHLSLGC